MVKRTQNSGRTELLFSMLLLFVFLLCSIFTVLIGSRVYENIRARDNESFYRDTALSYVVNKVRQADETGAVEVRDEGDTSVLVLTSQINGSLYETWIYTLDGTLRELFTPKDSGLTTADGLEISSCPKLTFLLEDRGGKKLLTICQSSPESETSSVSPAASEGSETQEEDRRVSLLLRSSGGTFTGSTGLHPAESAGNAGY